MDSVGAAAYGEVHLVPKAQLSLCSAVRSVRRRNAIPSSSLPSLAPFDLVEHSRPMHSYPPQLCARTATYPRPCSTQTLVADTGWIWHKLRFAPRTLPALEVLVVDAYV